MSEYVRNAIGRKIPKYINGMGELTPYQGVFEHKPSGKKHSPRIARVSPGEDKLLGSIRESIERCDVKDGMTISFHHHFRNGDYLVNTVLDELANLGIKDLTLAASSLQSVHEPLIEHIKSGVVTEIHTSGIRGKLGEAVVKEKILKKPLIIRSHGGRARAIESGDIKIDVAFLAVPASDRYGNVNGVEGPTACGSLGYAIPDAEYAERVVAITDNLVPYPACPISIPQTLVDYVVEVDEIGDPKGIMSDATRITRNPMEIQIAKNAAKVIEASGLLTNGFSFQAGTGGASLATASFLREIMLERNVTGSFVTGGINGFLVDMLEEGLFKSFLDVQCFDLKAVESIKENPHHMEMSSSFYGNPHNKGCATNLLDVLILSATEIDINYNVNVITDSNGMIMGASGGHSDTAAGAKLAIVVAPLLRGRLPIIVDEVTNVITPGETVDVVVTERGVAVNPRREDLAEKLTEAGVKVLSIEEMKAIAEDLTGKPEKIKFTDDVVGLIEYRDGTIIDVIWGVE